MDKKQLLSLSILGIAGIILLFLVLRERKAKKKQNVPAASLTAEGYPSAPNLELPALPATPDYMRITSPVNRNIGLRSKNPCDSGCNCNTSSAPQQTGGTSLRLADMVADLASVGVIVGSA